MYRVNHQILGNWQLAAVKFLPPFHNRAHDVELSAVQSLPTPAWLTQHKGQLLPAVRVIFRVSNGESALMTIEDKCYWASTIHTYSAPANA